MILNDLKCLAERQQKETHENTHDNVHGVHGQMLQRAGLATDYLDDLTTSKDHLTTLKRL